MVGKLLLLARSPSITNPSVTVSEVNTWKMHGRQSRNPAARFSPLAVGRPPRLGSRPRRHRTPGSQATSIDVGLGVDGWPPVLWDHSCPRRVSRPSVVCGLPCSVRDLVRWVAYSSIAPFAPTALVARASCSASFGSAVSSALAVRVPPNGASVAMAKIQTLASRVLDKLRSASQPNDRTETRSVVDDVDELRRELRQLEADAEELERARAAHIEQAATYEAQAMEALSSRSVITWKSSSAPRGSRWT